MAFRNMRIGVFALALLTASGCVQQSVAGNTTTFSYELWVSASVLVAGIAVAGVGWAMKGESSIKGIGYVVIGLLIGIVGSGSLYLDRATASPSAFTLNTGFFGATSVHTVQMSEVASVHIESETKTGRKGRKQTNFYVIYELKNGTSQKVPSTSEISQAAANRFLTYAKDRGIPITSNL